MRFVLRTRRGASAELIGAEVERISTARIVAGGYPCGGAGIGKCPKVQELQSGRVETVRADLVSCSPVDAVHGVLVARHSVPGRHVSQVHEHAVRVASRATG